jgi:hypothetical protein
MPKNKIAAKATPAHDAKTTPSAPQPQPTNDTEGALHPPYEEEEFALTPEIEFSNLLGVELNTVIDEGLAGLYRRDEATRKYKRDRVIPGLSEAFARIAKPGLAAKYRLPGEPTQEEFCESKNLSLNTAKSWIRRANDPLLGLEWTKADKARKLTAREEELEKKIHLVVDDLATDGDKDKAIKKLKDAVKPRSGRDTKPERPDNLPALALSLVREVEALYNGQLALMPKKLAVIVEKIKTALGAEQGQPKPPVSATPDSQEQKEGTA